MTHFPKAIFAKLLPWAASAAVGWLEVVDELHQFVDMSDELPSTTPVKTRLLDIDPTRMWDSYITSNKSIMGVERDKYGRPKRFDFSCLIATTISTVNICRSRPGWGYGISLSAGRVAYTSGGSFGAEVAVAATTDTVNDGNPHLLRVVRSGADVVFYIDGVMSYQTTMSAPLSTVATDLAIAGDDFPLGGLIWNVEMVGVASYPLAGTLLEATGGTAATKTGSADFQRIPPSAADPTVDAIAGQPLTHPAGGLNGSEATINFCEEPLAPLFNGLDIPGDGVLANYSFDGDSGDITIGTNTATHEARFTLTR